MLFALIVTGCGKDNQEEAETFEMTAKKNGKEWIADRCSYMIIDDNNIVVIGEIVNDIGYLREYFICNYIPLEIGEHVLLRRILNSPKDTIYSSYTTVSDDGDVVEDRFVVLENEDNFIKIDTIDFMNEKITGSFQVTFVRDTNDYITNPDLPDTIRFTDGEFKLKLDEKK